MGHQGKKKEHFSKYLSLGGGSKIVLVKDREIVLVGSDSNKPPLLLASRGCKVNKQTVVVLVVASRVVGGTIRRRGGERNIFCFRARRYS